MGARELLRKAYEWSKKPENDAVIREVIGLPPVDPRAKTLAQQVNDALKGTPFAEPAPDEPRRSDHFDAPPKPPGETR